MNGLADDWNEYTIWQSLRNDGYDMSLVGRFAYPPKANGKEDNQGDVVWIAHKLMDDINELSRKSVAQGGSAKVDVIAYSLGGPISRYYLGRGSPDRHGTIYGNNVGKLIEVGAANNGSYWLAIYDAISRNVPVPYLPDLGPFDNEIKKAIINFTINQLYPYMNLPVPNPASTAGQQMIPDSSLLRDINQPDKSPKDVDYHTLYGDIDLRLEMNFFGWPIVNNKELVNVGDFAISKASATTIPGIGSLAQANAKNYHAYGYPATAKMRLEIKLGWPGFEVTNPSEILRDTRAVWHGGLNQNERVKAQILAILNVGTTTTPQVPPGAGDSTATILVLDISGSMSESWHGGAKIESAKEAAQRFLSMLEAESKAGEVSHKVAIVTFSSDAYLSLGLTTDYARAKAIVAGLRPTAQTNIGAALQKANEALRQASGNPKKIIVLLTDGMTNTGLPREQILSGPVAEAAQAGTCIYTIGFGEANNLDEAFLKQVAQATRCGQYYYGAAGFDLQNLYIKVRHESTGNIIGEFAGRVRQGETVTAGQVEVKPWQQDLRASLNWPGSKLDLVVTDPRGRRLDRSYPGITVFAEGPLVYIIVKEPLAGFWQIAVAGQEVPGSGTEYRVIVSTVQGTVPQVQVNPALVASLGLMLLLILAVGVGIAVSRRPAYGPPTPVSRGAGLRVVDGPLAGTFIPFRGGMLTIGRAPGNTLTLPDPQVSHTHAHIVAVTGGLAIYDRNSRNGTFVNGQRVPAASLRPGNEIRVGNTRLRFEVYG